MKQESEERTQTGRYHNWLTDERAEMVFNETITALRIVEGLRTVEFLLERISRGDDSGQILPLFHQAWNRVHREINEGAQPNPPAWYPGGYTVDPEQRLEIMSLVQMMLPRIQVLLSDIKEGKYSWRGKLSTDVRELMEWTLDRYSEDL